VCDATVKFSPRALLIYFALLFVSGLLIRVFISPILWPNISEITDLGDILVSSAMVILMLSVIYYLKTQGSPKQVRIFFTVALGVAIAFPFALVFSLALEVPLGVPRASLFDPFYLVGLVLGLVIGNWVGKRQTQKVVF
jgi:hypothetical protein